MYFTGAEFYKGSLCLRTYGLKSERPSSCIISTQGYTGYYKVWVLQDLKKQEYMVVEGAWVSPTYPNGDNYEVFLTNHKTFADIKMNAIRGKEKDIYKILEIYNTKDSVESILHINIKNLNDMKYTFLRLGRTTKRAHSEEL